MELTLFVAAKAFIVREGKILIVREASTYKDGSNVSRFDVPGGRLMPGENVHAALNREIYEETGLTVRTHEPFHVDEWRPIVQDERWHIVGIFFVCRVDADDVVLGVDHDEYHWIDPRTYAEYPIIETLLPAFETFLKRR